MGNKPLNDKPMVSIHVHVPVEVSAEINRIAKVRGVTRAQVVREWIELGRQTLVRPIGGQ